jgi:hypothetical protein
MHKNTAAYPWYVGRRRFFGEHHHGMSSRPGIYTCEQCASPDPYFTEQPIVIHTERLCWQLITKLIR